MIYVEDEEYRCGDNVPYADALILAGWKKRHSMLVTKDIELVLPFIEHLDPEVLAVLSEVSDAFEASAATETDFQVEIPAHNTYTLGGYQRVDVKYIIDHGNTLLAEECGTGKTAIMIVALNMLRVRRALIICPAVAKYNWALNEWPLWSTLKLTVGVAEGDNWPDTDVVIVNYDILPRHKKRIQAVEWCALLVDESHRANNKEARRTTMVLGGELRIIADEKKKLSAAEIAETYDAVPAGKRSYFRVPPINAKKRVFATGTPFNKPKNLWALVESFDPQGLGADWEDFHRRYCQGYIGQFGWDVEGADHQEELGALLRARFMVRHDADAVLNLPKQGRKLFLLPPVDLITSAEESFVKENLEALMYLGNKVGKPVNENTSKEQFMRIIGDAVLASVPLIGDPITAAMFTKFAKIREETGVAKVPHVIDYIKMRSDDGAIPTVVYGYHKRVMRLLKEAFPDSAFVVGGMSSEKRYQEVKRFQEGEVPYFFGNMDAAGENITLTRADRMIIAEPDWRGTQMHQVYMRIKRLGQIKETMVDVLCAAYSFDSIVAEVSFAKLENIERTLNI